MDSRENPLGKIGQDLAEFEKSLNHPNVRILGGFLASASSVALISQVMKDLQEKGEIPKPEVSPEQVEQAIDDVAKNINQNNEDALRQTRSAGLQAAVAVEKLTEALIKVAESAQTAKASFDELIAITEDKSG